MMYRRTLWRLTQLWRYQFADTITVNDHRFITGQRVVYNNGGGSSIGGLTSGDAYFIINNSLNTIKLAEIIMILYLEIL